MTEQSWGPQASFSHIKHRQPEKNCIRLLNSELTFQGGFSDASVLVYQTLPEPCKSCFACLRSFMPL